jgi:Zn-dependent protease with chaperone function
MDTYKIKVNQKNNIMKKNVSYTFRKFYQVVIIENDEIKNAWGGGFNIFISTSMINTLSKRELTAVIAHEISHREHQHIITRVGYCVGEFVLPYLISQRISLKQRIYVDLKKI